MHPKKLSQFDWRMYLGILLTSEQVRGEIIVSSIALEAQLDRFLSGYFAFPPKRQEFEQTVLARLSVSQKIDTLKNLDFSPKLKSFPELVKILSNLNRLRNHAAHASWGDGDLVVKLADNEVIRKAMIQFPKSFDQTIYRVRRLFSALERSNDYRRREPHEWGEDDIPF